MPRDLRPQFADLARGAGVVMASYTVAAIDEIEPALLADLSYDGKTHAVLRTNRIGRVQAWSFHTSASAASAAKRRWISRDVVTR